VQAGARAAPPITGEAAMKVILSVLVALSVVAGLSAPASATFKSNAKTKQIFDEIDRKGIN
jgi:hypothetical protein